MSTPDSDYALNGKKMGPELGDLAVEIVRFVDDYFPGIVACELVDAGGRRHIFIGKVPIFTTEYPLDANSEYPRQGGIRCTVLAHWNDACGRELVRVSIAEPDAVESTEGIEEFVVFRTSVKRIPRGHRELRGENCWVWVDDE